MKECKKCKSKALIVLEKHRGYYECDDCGYIFGRTYNIWITASLTIISWIIGFTAAEPYAEIPRARGFMPGIEMFVDWLLFIIVFLIIGYIFGFIGLYLSYRHKQITGQTIAIKVMATILAIPLVLFVLYINIFL